MSYVGVRRGTVEARVVPRGKALLNTRLAQEKNVKDGS